jgi:hypothetical protein
MDSSRSYAKYLNGFEFCDYVIGYLILRERSIHETRWRLQALVKDLFPPPELSSAAKSIT